MPSRPCGTAFETYLYVVNADGSGLRRLTTRLAHVFNPSWSADGKTIRYGHSLVHADGSGHSELPRNVPRAGVWSPDRQRIAVVSVAHSFADARNPTKLGLWVVNADGSNARRVAAKATSGDPAWSPDGRRIAFRRYDGKLGSIGNSDLFCRERRREPIAAIEGTSATKAVRTTSVAPDSVIPAWR